MDQQTEKQPFDLKAATRVFSRIGFALLGYLVVANLLVTAFTLGYMWLFQDENPSVSALSILSMLGLSILGPLFCRLFLGKLPASAPIRGRASLTTLLSLCTVAFFFIYAGNILGIFASETIGTMLNMPIEEGTLELVAQMPWYIALPVVVLVGPLAEEYVFRKLLLDRTRIYGEKLAILFSAILFAFYHSSIQQFFYALFVGLLLGYLYMRTGNLWYGYLIHAVVNFFGSVVPLLLMSHGGMNDILDALEVGSMEAIAAAMEAHPLGVLAIIVFGLLEMLLSLGGFVLFLRLRKKLRFYPAEADLPRDTEATVAFTGIGVILFIAFCVGFPILLWFL